MSILKRAICLSLIVMALNAQSVFPHENNIQIIEGEEYVYTPFGQILRECVQGVPSGTHVQKADDGSLHLRNDQQSFTKRVPINERCSKKNSQSQPNPNNLSQQTLKDHDWETPNDLFWQTQASWRFLDDTLSLQKFEGNFLVPGNPIEIGEQTLMYILSSVNEREENRSFIMATLTFYREWYSQSWYQDESGQVYSSTPVYGSAPGDLAYGSLEVSDEVITMISSNKDGEQSVLTLDREGRNYTYFRLMLNRQYTGCCCNYPSSKMEFCNMKITDQNGNLQSVEWGPYRSYQCNGVTTAVDSATVRIEQDSP